MQAIIDACESKKIPGFVAVVIYNKKDAYACTRAHKHSIPAVFLDQKSFPDADAMDCYLLNLLQEHQIDLVVLAGYLSQIGPKTTHAFQHRMINTHPSLIPSFCGKGFYGHHVHQAVIDYGAKLSGCTIHFVDEQMDTGPIILQQSVPVLEDDDADTLAARVLKVEHQLLPEAVSLFCQERISVLGRKVIINKQ